MAYNYFSYLCFGWAFVGIVTRILMIVFGERWNRWEMERAYTQKKPIWVIVISIISVIVVVFTWYQVFNLEVAYSWIIAMLTTLTLVKIAILTFNYDQFRVFASNTLNNPEKKMLLNSIVFVLSLVFIVLGIFVY
ncbi:hypothetical protein [Petrocella sp. FN5]|uniref:hypothetical protein n=1 Tax=Petrocella sp. FN5 TaxID=3032002 RepID=UPI0023DC7E2F|nr:hypothetical protein [Petrocella sp. FN5]MDF1616898.1 hypothetical protein [Petrocella sp. FN5]